MRRRPPPPSLPQRAFKGAALPSSRSGNGCEAAAFIAGPGARLRARSGLREDPREGPRGGFQGAAVGPPHCEASPCTSASSPSSRQAGRRASAPPAAGPPSPCGRAALVQLTASRGRQGLTGSPARRPMQVTPPCAGPRASPVVISGRQVADVLFQQEVGLQQGETRAVLLLGSAVPARQLYRPVPAFLALTPARAPGAANISWPRCPSPASACPATRPCPWHAACLSAPPPLSVLSGFPHSSWAAAGTSPGVLTILPPVALMCCCSASHCLSCGSAAYCNKAARTWLNTGHRPPTWTTLLRGTARSSALLPAPHPHGAVLGAPSGRA